MSSYALFILIAFLTGSSTVPAHAGVYDVILVSGDTLHEMVPTTVVGDVVYLAKEIGDTMVAVDDITHLFNVTSSVASITVGGVFGLAVGALAGSMSVHGGGGSPFYAIGGGLLGGAVGLVASAPRKSYDLRALLPTERRRLLTSLCLQ